MRKKRRKISLIIFLLVGWFLGTALFVFAGYCITGAIPVINIEMSYFDRLLMVIASPLDGYFNEYTPIGMIMGFLICEINFGIILCIMNRKPKENAIDVPGEDSYLGIQEKKADMEINFLEHAADKKTEEKTVKEEKASVKEVQPEEPEVDVMLQEHTFLELFSNGYSMQQITEMMELTKYIKNLDVSLLKRMFKTTMSPEDIRKHIESFYG